MKAGGLFCNPAGAPVAGSIAALANFTVGRDTSSNEYGHLYDDFFMIACR
jgi:hypothetical protein